MFSYRRLDYQARPHIRGASAFRHLVAKLPPRAHSIYYRDEIGNISTSHLFGDSRKVEFVLLTIHSLLFLFYKELLHIGNCRSRVFYTFLFSFMQTELEIEPRYPMFGGWRTSFTLGYGLPLQDFLFQSEGKRFLNISFGCPIAEVVIDKLIVKVSGTYILW